MIALLGLAGFALMVAGCVAMARGSIPKVRIHSRAGGTKLFAAGLALVSSAIIWSSGRQGITVAALFWSVFLAILGFVALVRGQLRQLGIPSRGVAGGTLATAVALLVIGGIAAPPVAKSTVVSAVGTAAPQTSQAATTALTRSAIAKVSLPPTSLPTPPATATRVVAPAPSTSTSAPSTATPPPATSTPRPPTATPNLAATATAGKVAANDALAVKHLGAGNTLLQAGNLNGALSEYSTAQALSPSRPDVQSAVGTAQARAAEATATAQAQAATATAQAEERNATATAQAQVQEATATAQADARATAQAQANATAQAQALVTNPPAGTFQANDGSVAVAAGDFRYFTQHGILQAGPGARYIACAVEVFGKDDISVNPLYFTLVMSDGSAYPIDDGMFS